ncbi:HNH endonuclease [Aliikangiella sp. IMCC44653]
MKSASVISFAERVMTLLEQGRFTSTYKYAVLLGLMDLSMEHFTTTQTPPNSVSTRQLAEKIIQIYWLQTNPFVITPNESAVLLQNAGRQGAQASIINHIVAFRQASQLGAYSPYFSAKHKDRKAFNKLVDQVEWTLIEMPLPRLQRMGASERSFIYSITWDDSIKKSQVSSYQKGTSKNFDNLIRFQPNVAGYLIQLSGLLRPLIQREWAARVAETNKLEEARLQSFLFNSNRASTAKLNEPLVELQNGRCFYCGKPVGSAQTKKPEVDHFIPWARYPNDSLANFVVAHRNCNAAKKDFLANEEHLANWVERLNNSKIVNELESLAEQSHWDVGLGLSENVSRAIYTNLQSGVELWKLGKEFTLFSKPSVSGIWQ